ncbi:succinylglutamate desuccinylase [Aliihoeflea aestuarii]|jgi:predicted deacylase|uniref:succinylglutamate desuccinylase/aspartoacylase family protein n=1 Tax=Aliihoeflea aestuarii TaxID=453840 RepID=UPI002092DDBD|nr:succinylglutamate desuccinylase/aspartoacylase family protein [Aliihoeflea aestuarii]MCO6390824.1 succinylglutamate desuccinylase [Aliihoeflea aestuarii]
MTRRSTAYMTVDFGKDGKQVGSVNIPHSPHSDAWGATVLPIAVVKNGTGPTLILSGGNHGDEYEGPIALGELIRDIDPGAIQGCLIVLPALNIPAVMAGTRTSPVDGLNLNRTYPGNPEGTISQQISAFMNDVVYPHGDAFLDLHSGGSSLDILPSAIVEPALDPAHQKRNVEAVLAFDAPLTVVVSNLGETRTSTASAVRAGLTTVGTEMGGGGTVGLEALAICRRGIHNVLAHLGLVENKSAVREDRTLFEVAGSQSYVLASGDGVFEPFHANGTEISAGQPAGRVHFLDDPMRLPAELIYRQDGIVYARRQPGRVKPGNCCIVVASPFQGDLA